MLELTLPYPPTVNHYKKIGRSITTKSGKSYQHRVNTNETKLFYYEVWQRILSLKSIKRMIEPIHSTISVEVDIYQPDKRKRDIDNVIKPLLDALVRGGLLQDDSQVCRLVVEKKSIIAKGQVILRIEELL